MSTIYTPDKDQHEAYVQISNVLERASGVKRNSHAFLLGPDSTQIQLPQEVYEILLNVVQAMQLGQGISVAPLNSKLTTQQAADLLGISRPTFIKMAESRGIKFDLVGKHRRIQLGQLLELQKNLNAERDDILANLSKTAKEINLYDLTKELIPKKQ